MPTDLADSLKADEEDRNRNDERIIKSLAFRSVTVWEPGTGGQDMDTRSSRRHFPHDEMDAVPNSQVLQRTVMASAALSVFNNSRLYSATEKIIAQTSTRHGDSDSHKKLSQFVSHFSSGREAEREVCPRTASKPTGNPRPEDNKCPAARQLAHWQAVWTSASRRWT